MERIARIPTPLSVRWQRLRYQLFPVLMVVFCAVVAWRLWQAAPQVAAVGQVDPETADARSPASGLLAEAETGKTPTLYDAVTAGQVVARVRQKSGKWVDVTAPLTGQVVKVHRQPKQPVKSGQSVFTIAAPRGRSITTYLRGGSGARPKIGDPVAVRPRSDAARTFQTVVDRVGAQYELVPPGQRLDQRMQEWGLPVVVAIPADVALRPGELVDVGWSAGGGLAGAGQVVEGANAARVAGGHSPTP